MKPPPLNQINFVHMLQNLSEISQVVGKNTKMSPALEDQDRKYFVLQFI